MAELIIHTDKIKQNIRILSEFFESHNIQWSLITKVFSGDIEFLKKVLSDDVIEKINSVGDSRLSSLKNLRTVKPGIRTIYIKPPATVYADDIVRYADISLNSSLETVRALDQSARDQNRVHKVIIMIEMGELREGIQSEAILDFYKHASALSNIRIIGLGSNLGCMYGVEPTPDKLAQLASYKHLIKRKFGDDIPLISGGSSITLPLVETGVVPREINHFRIGEAAFFGVSPLRNMRFGNLYTDTFYFKANIIEVEEKQVVPDGTIGEANIGQTAEFDQHASDTRSYKAILDFGMLDVDKSDLTEYDKDIEFVGITSDMIVIDIGDNETESGEIKYKVGDTIYFKPNYMAVARLLNSKFIDKKFVEDSSLLMH